MNWFNLYGLIFVAVIMVPNIVFAIKSKEGFANSWHCKPVEILEQIGRYGCFILMIFNIPGTYLGFRFDNAQTVYIAINSVLAVLYCAIWAVEFRKNNLFKAILLSTIPSAIFLFCGVMLLSVPLLLAAVTFAPCHILISCKNATRSL